MSEHQTTLSVPDPDYNKYVGTRLQEEPRYQTTPKAWEPDYNKGPRTILYVVSVRDYNKNLGIRLQQKSRNHKGLKPHYTKGLRTTLQQTLDNQTTVSVPYYNKGSRISVRTSNYNKCPRTRVQQVSGNQAKIRIQEPDYNKYLGTSLEQEPKNQTTTRTSNQTTLRAWEPDHNKGLGTRLQKGLENLSTRSSEPYYKKGMGTRLQQGLLD